MASLACTRVKPYRNPTLSAQSPHAAHELLTGQNIPYRFVRNNTCRVKGMWPNPVGSGFPAAGPLIILNSRKKMLIEQVLSVLTAEFAQEPAATMAVVPILLVVLFS